MSTYAELELRCKRRLGRRGMTITTEFLDEMKAAQEKLERNPTLPRFLKVREPGVGAAGATTLVNPADFIRFYDDAGIEYTIDGTTEKKFATRLDTFQQLQSKINNGIPEGQMFYFIDESSSGITFRINEQTEDFSYAYRYYKKQPVLTGANDNKWTTGPQAEYIMAMAGVELAVWLRDDRALKYFTDLEAKERRSMVSQIESDEWGDTDLVMGDPD